MNADEMFEDLGYKKKETEKEIKFVGKKNVIWFYKDTHLVAYADLEETNIQERRAINQKLKELNWSTRVNVKAEEMFEELGYKKKYRKYDNVIIYSKYNGDFEVYFDLKDEEVLTRQWIYKKLLKAINQQCKELGWLDEEEEH